VKRSRPANYGAFTALARKANMTRREYAAHLVQTHGTPEAAAAAVGMSKSTIQTALRYKPTGRNRIMLLAERAGMTTRNFVFSKYEECGSNTRVTAEALKVDISTLNRYLKHDPHRDRKWKPMPELKRRKILQLLRDGFRVTDVARMTDTHPNTVRYWHTKLARMKQSIRRLEAA
jgi:transposase